MANGENVRASEFTHSMIKSPAGIHDIFVFQVQILTRETVSLVRLGFIGKPEPKHQWLWVAAAVALQAIDRAHAEN